MTHAAPAITVQGIGQIQIPVRDLDRAVRFYRDTLGLSFLFQAPPGLAFFDCGGVRLMLARPEAGEEWHPGSTLYFRVPDLDAAHAALAESGAELVSPPHLIAKLERVEVWMSFFRDGEGNLMALMSERAR